MVRKTIATVAFALVLLTVGAYYYLSGEGYVIRLSEADIQAKLEQKLPLTKTYYFIIKVTLDNPRVHLENGSNKISAGLDITFSITLDKHPKPLGGTVDVSGGLMYLAEKGQFYLTDPVIENLNVQGIAPKYTAKAKKALSKALAHYYSQHPIYTLRATDAKKAVAKMVLRSVIVENQELVVTLGL